MSDTTKVAIGLPSGDGWVWHYSRDAAQYACREHKSEICHDGTSAIPSAFGLLWCWALNGDYTHFAMLHSDVAAEPQWCDKMIAMLDAEGLDLLSAVVPIKSEYGVTSTAIQTGADGDFHRRVTISETRDLPSVFGPAELGLDDGILLVNTGCWVCRIRDEIGGDLRPWARAFPGFSMDSPIFSTEVDGKETFYTRLDPEDWRMSRWLHGYGASYKATSAIQTKHHGGDVWDSRKEFGFDTDVVFWKWYEQQNSHGVAVMTETT